MAILATKELEFPSEDASSSNKQDEDTDADHGAISLSWCREFGGIEPQFPNDRRAVTDYWKRFCELEDEDN
jgi:hypothetical protein